MRGRWQTDERPLADPPLSRAVATDGASPRKRHALALFSPLPASYDRVGALMSFGQDRRWREAMVAGVGAGPGESVLDVATGTGMVAAALVRRYGCEVTGIDQSAEMLAAAEARRGRDERLGSHLRLIQGEAEHLPFADGQFDHLTFTWPHSSSASRADAGCGSFGRFTPGSDCP